MRLRRRRGSKGFKVLLALALVSLAATACGTRLPDDAFVNAGAGGGGTAAGTKSGAAGTKSGAAGAGSATQSGGATAGAGGPGDTTPGAGGDAAAAAGGVDGPNQASDTGVTENEIVIGNITAVDGILGNAFAPPLRGLEAFVQYTNDHGGVHGRTLRLESCNDSEQRNTDLSCAQDLIQNKHVFAFVADNTRAEGGGVPYIDSQGVPVFMGLPISNGAYRFPHYWTIYGTGCPRDGTNVCYSDNLYNTTVIYRWFKDHVGTHKAAVFYYGLIAISADAGAFVQQGLKLEGYDVTGYDVNFANPNFDQAVQEMKTNGTDMILDVIDDGTNRKLCDTMQRYNLTTIKAKVSTVVSYGDEVGTDFSDVCRNSIYISGSTMSYDSLDNPAVKEFRDAFATYEPDAPLHQWSLEGWMAGKAFVDAVNSMGASPTRAGLEAWLNGLTKYTNGGLSIPIDYKQIDYPSIYAAEQASNTGMYTGDCTAIAQWQDDKQGWVQRTGPQGDCYDGTWVFPTKASDRGD